MFIINVASRELLSILAILEWLDIFLLLIWVFSLTGRYKTELSQMQYVIFHRDTNNGLDEALLKKDSDPIDTVGIL